MYRHVVTLCTAQWSRDVPPSGHVMYSQVVTLCTAKWSRYVLPSGHVMYRQVPTEFIDVVYMHLRTSRECFLRGTSRILNCNSD